VFSIVFLLVIRYLIAGRGTQRVPVTHDLLEVTPDAGLM
jgi:hypothetical protein